MRFISVKCVVLGKIASLDSERSEKSDSGCKVIDDDADVIHSLDCHVLSLVGAMRDCLGWLCSRVGCPTEPVSRGNREYALTSRNRINRLLATSRLVFCKWRFTDETQLYGVYPKYILLPYPIHLRLIFFDHNTKYIRCRQILPFFKTIF
jgi:hypothetical protein